MPEENPRDIRTCSTCKGTRVQAREQDPLQARKAASEAAIIDAEGLQAARAFESETETKITYALLYTMMDKLFECRESLEQADLLLHDGSEDEEDEGYGALIKEVDQLRRQIVLTYPALLLTPRG